MNSLENIKERIILVEDNEDDCFMIEYMVQSRLPSHTVSVFPVGSDALDCFSKNGASCIILDYLLGDQDGLTLISEFKKYDPFIPIIMLTGQGSEELASSSIKLGAFDYFVKSNLNEVALAAAIQNAMNQAMLERKLATQDADRNLFLQILIHDLRAPLQSISDWSNLVMEEEKAGNMEEMRHGLLMQKKVADRVNKLIATLESFTLLDADIEMEPVCLAEVAQAAKENIKTIVSERNAVVTIEDLPTLYGNAPQLIQLLQNLIQNGLKYNESAIPKINIQCVSMDSQRVVLTIVDNGIGIPADRLTYILKPFNRLWEYGQYEGTGLGLAICRKIVQRHDGRIWCTSKEGCGSQFHLSFPVSEANFLPKPHRLDEAMTKTG